MKIGQKLKSKRMEAKISQEELAQRIGVSRQTISSWENDRSYPDIGSILKLSDLYGLSVDELLREDQGLREHMEKTARWTRTCWNVLYELAILMLPVGHLIIYFGFPVAGLVIQYAGVILLPVLWIVQWRVFGWDKKEMLYSIIGWAMWLGGQLIGRQFGDESIPEILLSIGCYVVSFAGLLTIYANTPRLESSTRKWLVIALFFGIHLYILGSLGSALLSIANSQGAFSEAQPFGKEYTVEEVLYQAADDETDSNAYVELDANWRRLYIDDELVGIFEYRESASAQENVKGVWELIDEEGLYKLVVDQDDHVTLSCQVDDQLQWRWQLREMDELIFEYSHGENIRVENRLKWYYSGEYKEIPYYPSYSTAIYCPTEMEIDFAEGEDSLTVIEEYYHGGEMEQRELTLEREEDGDFHMTVDRRYPDGEQYVIYRIPWSVGEYVIDILLEE